MQSELGVAHDTRNPQLLGIDVGPDDRVTWWGTDHGLELGPDPVLLRIARSEPRLLNCAAGHSAHRDDLRKDDAPLLALLLRRRNTDVDAPMLSLVPVLVLPDDHLLHDTIARRYPVATLCIHVQRIHRLRKRARERPVLRVLHERLPERAAHVRLLAVLVRQLVEHVVRARVVQRRVGGIVERQRRRARLEVRGLLRHAERPPVLARVEQRPALPGEPEEERREAVPHREVERARGAVLLRLREVPVPLWPVDGRGLCLLLRSSSTRRDRCHCVC